MFDDLLNNLTASFESFLESAANWLPKIAMGIVLLLIALLVGKLLERAARGLFTRLKLDAALERIGIAAMLKKIGIKASFSERVLPRGIYYLFLIVVLQTAVDVLGLKSLSSAMAAFFAYLPNLFAAVALLVAGGLAAQFAGGVVKKTAENSGIDFAASLGSAVAGMILFVVGIMAVGQLKLDTDIIRLVSTCLLGGLALAFGLSFGLGTRDITRNILAGFYARKVFQPGQRFEVDGVAGTLRSITPTQVLLDQGDVTIAVANSIFLDKVVKQDKASDE